MVERIELEIAGGERDCERSVHIEDRFPGNLIRQRRARLAYLSIDITDDDFDAAITIASGDGDLQDESESRRMSRGGRRSKIKQENQNL